ncbi:MAG: transposase [Salinibacter sp.]
MAGPHLKHCGVRDGSGKPLTFMASPESIWSVVYPTNWLERVIREVRKRVRQKWSFPTEEAAETMIYLNAIELNDRWEQRSLQGFKAARDQL